MQSVINFAIAANFVSVFPSHSIFQQMFTAVWLKSSLPFPSALVGECEMKLNSQIMKEKCLMQMDVVEWEPVWEMEYAGTSQWIRIKWKSISVVVSHLTRAEFKWIKALITCLNPHCVLPTGRHVLFWQVSAKQIIHNNRSGDVYPVIWIVLQMLFEKALFG